MDDGVGAGIVLGVVLMFGVMWFVAEPKNKFHGELCATEFAHATTSADTVRVIARDKWCAKLLDGSVKATMRVASPGHQEGAQT